MILQRLGRSRSCCVARYAGDSRRCSPPAAAAGAASRASGTLNGSGSTFQKTFEEAAIAGFQEQQPDVTVNYSAGRLRAGQERPADQGRRLRRHRQPARSPRTLERTRAARSSTSRLVARTDHGVVQPAGVDDAEARRRDAGQDLRRSRSRSGTTRRSRPSTPASTCRARPSPSRTAPTARAPRATSPSTSTPSTRPTGRSGAATPSNWPSNTQAGTGNPGVAQIVQQTDGCDRLRRPRRRHGGEPADRGDQEQGRQVRRARRSRARGGGRGRDDRRRPHLRPDQRGRRRRPTRSRRRRGSSCTRTSRVTRSGRTQGAT